MNKRVTGVALLLCGLVGGVTEGKALSLPEATKRFWCRDNSKKCSKRLRFVGGSRPITEWTILPEYQEDFQKHWEQIPAVKKERENMLKKEKARERVITAAEKLRDARRDPTKDSEYISAAKKEFERARKAYIQNFS